MGDLGILREDLRAELRRCPHAPVAVISPALNLAQDCVDSHYIAIQHLHQANPPVIAEHVETLCLDIGRVHAFPCQVIFLELSVGSFFGLIGDGLDCGGSVDGFCHAESGALVSFCVLLRRTGCARASVSPNLTSLRLSRVRIGEIVNSSHQDVVVRCVVLSISYCCSLSSLKRGDGIPTRRWNRSDRIETVQAAQGHRLVQAPMRECLRLD